MDTTALRKEGALPKKPVVDLRVAKGGDTAPRRVEMTILTFRPGQLKGYVNGVWYYNASHLLVWLSREHGVHHADLLCGRHVGTGTSEQGALEDLFLSMVMARELAIDPARKVVVKDGSDG